LGGGVNSGASVVVQLPWGEKSNGFHAPYRSLMKVAQASVHLPT
jgi:hypothetical protein